MKVFFALAPELQAKSDEFRTATNAQTKLLGLTPFYLSDAPEDDPISWVADRMSECQLAIFDVSTRNPDVMVAYGLASETDVQPIVLNDPDVSKGHTPMRLVGPSPSRNSYYGAHDFQSKMRVAIDSVCGPKETGEL